MIRGNLVPAELKKRHKHKNVDKEGVELSYFLMRHFGWSYEEVMNLPIPAYMMLMPLIEKELKEQEKAMKRRR